MDDDELLSQELIELAAALGTALAARGWQLALAESCTGGLAAACITAVAGSSSWFDRGFVSYSNQAKQDLLGVSAQTIALYGAVSEQTAQEMAAGTLARSTAQIAASITGIAGPGGGTPQKPVGTVCFGWTDFQGHAHTETVHFSGSRQQVRSKSVKTLLQGLLRLTLSADL